MATHATGTFDVKISPQPPQDNVADPTVGRLSIDKQFHGDLEATSKGQTLTAMTDVRPSAHRHDDARRAAAGHHGGA